MHHFLCRGGHPSGWMLARGMILCAGTHSAAQKRGWKKATVGESTLKIFTRFSCIFNSPVPKQKYPPKGRINTHPNGFETTTGQLSSLSLAQRLASGIQKGMGRELHKDLQNSQCNITKTKTALKVNRAWKVQLSTIVSHNQMLTVTLGKVRFERASLSANSSPVSCHLNRSPLISTDHFLNVPVFTALVFL